MDLLRRWWGFNSVQSNSPCFGAQKSHPTYSCPFGCRPESQLRFVSGVRTATRGQSRSIWQAVLIETWTHTTPCMDPMSQTYSSISFCFLTEVSLYRYVEYSCVYYSTFAASILFDLWIVQYLGMRIYPCSTGFKVVSKSQEILFRNRVSESCKKCF